MSDRLITITDARRVYCVNGVREWFRERDLDFAHFIRNGMTEDELLGHGDDALIHRVMEAKDDAEATA